ncbi:MAG: flagellar hook-length control protein FliK [Planctomycetota bacterium]
MIANLLNQPPAYDAQALPPASSHATGASEPFDALLAQPADRKPGRAEPGQQPPSAADRRADRPARDEASASEPTRDAELIEQPGDAAGSDVGDPTDEGYSDNTSSPQDGEGVVEESGGPAAEDGQSSRGDAEQEVLELPVDAVALVIADVAAALVAPLADASAPAKPLAADQPTHSQVGSATTNTTPSDPTAKPTPASSVAIVDRPTGQAPTAEGTSLKPVNAQAPNQAATHATADGDTFGGDTHKQPGQQGGPAQHAAPANAQAANLATASATSAAASLTPDTPDPGLATRTSANAPPPPTPVPSTTTLAATNADADPDTANAARLARGLQSALNQRGGGVTLRLTPAEMGTIRISLDITAGRVAADFQPTTQAGQQLLQGQLAQLRSSLESQGLTVDRLGVQPAASTGNGNAAQNNTFFNQSQQDTPDGRQSSTDGRSRGEYGRSSQSSPDDTTDDAGPADTFDDALHSANPLAATAAGA